MTRIPHDARIASKKFGPTLQARETANEESGRFYIRITYATNWLVLAYAPEHLTVRGQHISN